jgi:Uma2 family endonuclease
MAEQALELMTVDEFLAWDDGSDIRHELVDGVIQAMAPPAGPHGTIASNANALIYNALYHRRPCRPQSEAGIRIDDRTCWQADIAVTCRPPAPETVDPLLVVEVLSPGTRTHDLGRKLNDYKSLPTVQEIWMVDSERRWLQLWQRDGERWIVRDLVGSAQLDSTLLDATVHLDDLYADSGL